MPKKINKILFCTPPQGAVDDATASFLEGGSSFPSIGLLILASIAREKGVGVVFEDLYNSGLDTASAMDVIRKESPDVVAISSNTDMIMSASALAGEIKRSAPGIKVIIGGPHVSAAAEETMEFCPDIDIAFRGEAETSFAKFLDSGFSPDGLKDINGICYRQDGGIVRTDDGKFIADLDTLPMPAWDLIKDMNIYRPAVTNYKKKPVFSLITSRGCSGRCIFCDRGVFGNRVRCHSAAYVIGMIDKLRADYGINEITFYDDNMAYDKKRLSEICAHIRKKHSDLSWSCSARVDLVNKAILDEMKASGCWQISYGIESGSQEVLNTIQKGIRIDKVKESVRLTKAAGMDARGYFIIGNPGETRRTLEETLSLIKELPLSDILVEYMTPYPGTELYRDLDKYGAGTRDWTKLNSYSLNFIPRGMDEAVMKEFFYRFYRAFYLRPGIVVNYLKRLKNPVNVMDLGIKYIKFNMAGKGGKNGK